MANLAKSGTPSLSSLNPPASNFLTLIAGEAIAAGDACYVKSDGKIWLSDGSAADALAVVDGFAQAAAAANEPVTIGWGVRMKYAAGMTPGTPYYLSTDPGALSDAATTGGTKVIARAVDATRLEVTRSWP